MDKVKNEDHDDDDVSDGELHQGAENFCRHRVGILPTDPPDVELSPAVNETVDMRDADDQQQSNGHSLCLQQ